MGQDRNEEKGVVSLLKEYARAAKQIMAASRARKQTVEEYQKNLSAVVNAAIKGLNGSILGFSFSEIAAAAKEGVAKADGAVPAADSLRNAAEHREKMTRKQAAAELRRYGLRYDGASSGRSGRGYNAHNTYIELRNATQAAGNGFLSRVNKQIDELRKKGNDSVYNVTQAVKEDIQKQGLLNVEYSNGRKVDISSYARMAARSARMESANIAAFGRALENGTDYVRCTEIYPTCEICAKYQGRIYCISGRDKRFPALFETALRRGYALMHPNCRHEFIPVWLETMTEEELAEEIRRSRIPQTDTRSVKERNAYAAWQDGQRQRYDEQLYFDKATQELGSSMPYKDIGAFRRAYRAEENSIAYKRSHNLIRDYQNLQRYRDELGRNSLPKTLESYQQIVYNKDDHDNMIHYVAARRSGTVSAVASFSDWQTMNTKLNTLFVGKTAANGVQIKSVSRHFVDRAIGTIYKKDGGKKREGVSVANLQNIIMHGKVGRTKTDSMGRKSTLLYIDGVGDVTINSETGVLVQCNPNSK